MNKESSKETKDNYIKIKDLWFHAIIAIFVLAFFITIIALCYALITTPPRQGNASFDISFPWVGWLVSMLISPALILSIVYIAKQADKEDGDTEESTKKVEWEQKIPKRWQPVYAFIKNAPFIATIISLLALSITIFTIDGAVSIVSSVIHSFMPYIPYLIGGVVLFSIIIAILLAVFKYKNNKLQAEYAFRQEIFEKTGVIIVDKKTQAILPPSFEGQQQIEIISTSQSLKALPQSQIKDITNKSSE
ncbi:hypothetical protein [Desulfovibrio litoralis]|uniref:Uncharacterized protein n=1 Tax=Desulfovibrio litoralis DSM 11393 TaxID=1121455 RepID=A0A1M7SP30_9BACT|nr:hypothetical protein [Desulfovibrio litoralis]SHN60273.1 hypothetical protein SAMN02745728_01109 [Desulfovibrio litoralis DSM 11393]